MRYRTTDGRPSNQIAKTPYIVSTPTTCCVSTRDHLDWRRLDWKWLCLLLMPSLIGCHPFGLRFRDTAQNSISVEPLGPPSVSEDSERRVGSKSHPTLSSARDAKKRMQRLSGLNPRNGVDPYESDAAPSIIDSPTPDADIEQSLAGIPPALQTILAKQMLAMKNRDAEPISSPTKSNATPYQEEPIADIRLGRPEALSRMERDEASEGITPPKNKKSRSQEAVRLSFTDRDSEANSEVRRAGTRIGDADDSNVATALAQGQNANRSSSKRASTFPEKDSETPENSTELGAWKRNLVASIEQLRQQIKDVPELEEGARLQQEATLRMLQLANGDLEASMEEISNLSENEKDYFKHQFKALWEATQPNAIPIKSRRWGVVMNSQRQANEQLSELSNMEVKSTAICTSVEGFGVITKFPKYQFRPEQELLLYCELDNIKAEKIQEGFETQLQGNYEIIDKNGTRVADQLLPMEREVCKNRRRDFFIVYKIYMPMQIAPGGYQLRLTIEDMKAHKYGQSAVDFQIIK